MVISLRPISKEDLPLVCEWHRDHVQINFPDSKYKEDLFLQIVKENLMARKTILWMVCHEKEKIGLLWLKILYDQYKEYNYCDLHYIHLIPSYRGKGIGKYLMKQTERWAREHRAKEIRLGTHVDNAQAIQLYQKDGFIIKRVIMEKRLL